MGKGKKSKMLWTIAGFFIGAGWHTAFKGASWLAGGMYGASLAGTLWSTFNQQKVDTGDGAIQRFDKVMNTMSSTATIPVVYGECKWGGNQTYHKTNPELNVLRKHVVVCEGGIDGIVSVSANELLIPTTPQAEGTVFTIQNVKYPDAKVTLSNKKLLLSYEGKVTEIYLANKDDGERQDLYDFNTNISALVSYINRLGEGWQAYPYATTNKYPGDLKMERKITVTSLERNDVRINCQRYGAIHMMQQYCPYCEQPEGENTSQCKYKDGDKCLALERSNNPNNCYNNPIPIKAESAKGNTYFSFHDCEAPDTYDETGGYTGCAWIDLNLAVSDELNGNPNITMIVRGKKVYDPRTGQTAYSTNPALCIRDLLTSKRYGLGKWISAEDIDDNSIAEAADYCDKIIEYPGVDGTIIKAKRYELNMILDNRKNAIEWIGNMLANFCGYLVLSNDRISLRIEKATPVSYKFNDSNIAQGSLTVSPISLDDTPNRYEITFVDPLNNWSSVKALVEDFADQKERGKVITKSVELSGVKSQHLALRLGRFYRDYNAVCYMNVSFTTAMQAMHLEPGDVVTVSYHKVFENLPVRISEIKETNKGTFEIVGRQYNADIYNDALGATIQPYGYGSDPNAVRNLIPAKITNVVCYTNTDDEILVTHDESKDDNFKEYRYYIEEVED